MDFIRIGSAPDNDLVFDVPMVSSHHARLERADGEGPPFLVVDLGSTNGTFVAGVRVQRARVAPGDTIGLGSFRFELTEAHVAPLRRAQPQTDRRADTTPEHSVSRASAMATLATTIEDLDEAMLAHRVRKTSGLEVVTIGYHERNTLVVRAPQVSSFHARLERDGAGVLRLVDLDSTNGTFVRGQRIEAPTRVEPGEVVGLGSFELTLDESVLGHFGAAVTLDPEATTAPRPALPVASSREGGGGGVPFQTISLDVSEVFGSRERASQLELAIGRADDNDIVIPAPQVSGYHALLRHDASGDWVLLDRGSLNGTYVNTRVERLEPLREVKVTTEDVIFLGSYRFPMSRIAEFVREAGDGEALALPQGKDVITIGRGPENDIVLDAPSVSRRHARLERQGEHWVLIDCGSANGTYVDGTRVTRCRISPENAIAFGSYQLRLDPNAGLAHTGYQGEIMLRAESISIDVRDKQSAGGVKRLISDISFTAYPTEFIGIMGPSGAGKTTLMMALNGYLPPTRGQSLINNLDLYEHYNQFRGNIGYVPQDDIIHRELTVFESLYFTAKLRLPPDTSDAEISRLIDRILADLGILETKHVVIGSPLKKGISGGQRKRVNLAQELITQPSLLFLDEPTSGLASSDTRSVMQLLRRLADEGRTILLTIHQPSLEAYKEMDNVLYLARGRLVYYGPTWPDSILFLNRDVDPDSNEAQRLLLNADSAMAPLAEDNAAPDAAARLEDRCREYQSSRYHEDYVAGRRESQGQVQLTPSKKQRAERSFGWRQWWILTRRTLTIKRKDVANSAILLLQAPIIGLLISIVFNLKNQVTGGPIEQFMAHQGAEGIDAAALFMLVASAVWFGTSNSAREIVGELAIYRRERMVNLKIPSYVLSKFTVLSLLSLVQCTVLLGIAHPLLGMHGNFGAMLAMLFLCSTAGLGIGLALSALVRSTEAAVALVPLLLIPQLVLGGLIVPLSNLDGGVRTAVRWGSNAMIARWAFEGMLHAEQSARPEAPRIEVDREEELLADAFELTPQTPPRQRSFGGVPLPDRERTRQLEALFKKRLAQVLDSNQRERTLLDRYFGPFSSGYVRALMILLTFNVGLLLLVCLLLRRRDMEVS